MGEGGRVGFYIYVVRGGKVHVCADAGIPLVDCELVLGFGVV